MRLYDNEDAGDLSASNAAGASEARYEEYESELLGRDVPQVWLDENLLDVLEWGYSLDDAVRYWENEG